MEQLFQEKPATPGRRRSIAGRSCWSRFSPPSARSESPSSRRRPSLPKSTVSRLLGVLERHGLVAQDGERGALRPGPAILTYAQRGLYERNIVALAEPSLEVLAAASGETINLAVPGRRRRRASCAGRRAPLPRRRPVGRAPGRLPLHRRRQGLSRRRRRARAARPAGRRTRRRRSSPATRSRRSFAASRRAATPPRSTSSSRALRRSPRRSAAATAGRRRAFDHGPTLRLRAGDIERLLPLLKRESEHLSHRLGHSTQGEHAA